MLRKRGIFASRRTTQHKPAAEQMSTAAADERTHTTTTKPAGTVFGSREPTPREIRDRAYYIYLARGSTNGDAVADWVQAERECREERRGATPGGRSFR